jgi:hypothetical protein
MIPARSTQRFYMPDLRLWCTNGERHEDTGPTKLFILAYTRAGSSCAGRILGWVQILKSNGMPPERSRHALDVIGRNATLQARLIEDILDVSRIIAGWRTR